MRWLLPGIVAMLVVALIAWPEDEAVPPRISYVDGTPGDVMALGDSTFADVLGAFPAQRHCIRDVTVAHNWDLGEEAGVYRGDYIEIEVPNTRTRIRATYVHEFGHHLDWNCADEEVRAAFLAAMGHAPGTDWYGDDRPWEQRPTEQFAEAVVVVTGGSSIHPEISLTSDAVRVVEDWAR